MNSPVKVTLDANEIATVALALRTLLGQAEELDMTRESIDFHEQAMVFHEVCAFKIPDGATVGLLYSGPELVAIDDALEEVENEELRQKFLKAAMP